MDRERIELCLLDDRSPHAAEQLLCEALGLPEGVCVEVEALVYWDGVEDDGSWETPSADCSEPVVSVDRIIVTDEHRRQERDIVVGSTEHALLSNWVRLCLLDEMIS